MAVVCLIVGALVIIALIGALILGLGYVLFEGALKLVIGIFLFLIIFFALKGCMAG